MRGFLITMDAAVGVMFMFVIAALVSGQTFQPSAPAQVYLKQVTLDTLSVLRGSGALDEAIGGNSTQALLIMQASGGQTCMQISISDSSGSAVATLAKAGCGNAGSGLQTAAMPFVHQGEPYMVEAEAWTKEGGGG